MIAGGTGGANTITGKYFEVATDLKTALTEAGYNLNDFFFLSSARLSQVF